MKTIEVPDYQAFIRYFLRIIEHKGIEAVAEAVQNNIRFWEKRQARISQIPMAAEQAIRIWEVEQRTQLLGQLFESTEQFLGRLERVLP